MKKWRQSSVQLYLENCTNSSDSNKSAYLDIKVILSGTQQQQQNDDQERVEQIMWGRNDGRPLV